MSNLSRIGGPVGLWREVCAKKLSRSTIALEVNELLHTTTGFYLLWGDQPHSILRAALQLCLLIGWSFTAAERCDIAKQPLEQQRENPRRGIVCLHRNHTNPLRGHVRPKGWGRRYCSSTTYLLTARFFSHTKLTVLPGDTKVHSRGIVGGSALQMQQPTLLHIVKVICSSL